MENQNLKSPTSGNHSKNSNGSYTKIAISSMSLPNGGSKQKKLTVKNLKQLVQLKPSAINELILNISTMTHSFFESSLPKDEVKKIGQELSGWTTLEKLEVNAAGYPMDNMLLMDLAKNFGKLEDLKLLDIDLCKTNIIDDGIENVFLQLKNLSKLENLSLALGWLKITNMAIIYLCELLDSLESLQKLKLCIYQTKINQVSLLRLAEHIGQHKSIQRFELWINEKVKIETKEIIVSKILSVKQNCIVHIM